ncbi:MAG: hypothetical protein IMZ55_02765 [Acidobacteria bacterium]|nr:hypothetical protein [Acidobacteriota bacterium]
MRAVWSLAVASVLVLAAGCGQQGLDGATELKSVSRTPPRPVDRVDRIDLFAAPPAAINWDNVPGVDGIQARVLLYQFDQPQPVLAKGSMEFAIYEGRLERESGETAQPLRVWRFTTEQMASYRFRGLFGWGYAVRLGWGREVPATSVITLSVQYISPSGPACTRRPSRLPSPRPPGRAPSRRSWATRRARGAAPCASPTPSP